MNLINEMNMSVIHQHILSQIQELKKQQQSLFSFLNKSTSLITKCITEDVMKILFVMSQNQKYQNFKGIKKCGDCDCLYWKQKYEQIYIQNKENQREFNLLMEQVNRLKSYLQEMKAEVQVQVNTQVQPQQNIEDKKCELQILQSKTLEEVQQKQRKDKSEVSTFTNSQNLLHTICEVTQKSVGSDEQIQQMQKQRQDQRNGSILRFSNKISQKLLAESKSFQCTNNNDLYDITNILFSSQFIQKHRKQKQNETIPQNSIQQSLSYLKVYLNSIPNSCAQQSFTRSSSNRLEQTILPFLPIIQQPHLIFNKMVSPRLLVFQNDFTYQGNTILEQSSQKNMGKIVKMHGYGQLLKNNNIFYEGEWKNSKFSGWGKLHYEKHQISDIKNINGKWKQGILQGPATVNFKNSSKFTGTFRQGKINGEGMLQNNGKIVRGVWRESSLVVQLS